MEYDSSAITIVYVDNRNWYIIINQNEDSCRWRFMMLVEILHDSSTLTSIVKEVKD